MTGTQAVAAIFVPYGQGRGRGLDEMELGAHGAEVDQLVALGLPVVPGLTVPIWHAASLVRPDVAGAALNLLQQVAGRRFGDPEHPLLIRLLASTSVSRAGVPADLPGLGITAASAPGLDQISALRTLELHMRGAVQAEFEVRDAELTLLAARKVERPAPRTAIRLAVDLAEAGVIDDVTAVGSIRPADIETLLHPQLQLTGGETEFARGLPASAGAAAGRIALSSERAVEWSEGGDPVILVAEETTPGDLPGILAAKAVVTMRGGLAAHAAVVARGLGRPAVCGATGVRIDHAGRIVTSAGQSLAEGELISVDGSSGVIYAGAVQVIPPRPAGDLEALLRCADRVRRLGVRTNADNGRDAALAVQYGAEGVGLCRTEHQFLGDRLPLVRQYLLAADAEEEAAALVELAAAQKEDFLDLLTVTGHRPVTVRLLDAPLVARRPPGRDADRAVPGAGAGAFRRVGGPGRRRRHPAARGHGAAGRRRRGAGRGRRQHPPRRGGDRG